MSSSKYIAAGGPETEDARLWDAASGELRHTLAGHAQGVRKVRFSPDSRCLAVITSDATVKLWDVPSGKIRATLKGHDGQYQNLGCIAFSPDRILASGSFDQTIRLRPLPEQPADEK
jgi:WD40 repeat protein